MKCTNALSKPQIASQPSSAAIDATLIACSSTLSHFNPPFRSSSCSCLRTRVAHQAFRPIYQLFLTLTPCDRATHCYASFSHPWCYISATILHLSCHQRNILPFASPSDKKMSHQLHRSQVHGDISRITLNSCEMLTTRAQTQT